MNINLLNKFSYISVFSSLLYPAVKTSDIDYVYSMAGNTMTISLNSGKKSYSFYSVEDYDVIEYSSWLFIFLKKTTGTQELHIIKSSNISKKISITNFNECSDTYGLDCKICINTILNIFSIQQQNGTSKLATKLSAPLALFLLDGTTIKLINYQ